MFSSLERLHSIGKRAHYTLAWISPLLRYLGEPSHPSLARQTCVPMILWRTGVSPVPPDCVGTAAQACLSIVEGAVRPRIARRHSGKGTASQAAKKLCFGTYLGREMSLVVPFVIPNRFSGEESAFASFSATYGRHALTQTSHVAVARRQTKRGLGAEQQAGAKSSVSGYGFSRAALNV